MYAALKKLTRGQQKTILLIIRETQNVMLWMVADTPFPRRNEGWSTCWHLLARSWSSLWLFFFYLYSQIFSWHIQYFCSSFHQGQYFHLDLQIDIHSLNVLFPGKPASQDWLPKIQTSRDYLNFKQEGAPLTIDEAIVFDGPMLVCTFACKNYICHSYWLWTSLISPRRVSQGLSQSPLNVFKCSSSMFVEHTVHSVSRVKQQHGSLFPRSLAQSLGCIPKH